MKNKKGFAKKAVAFMAVVLMLVMLPLNVLAAIPQDVWDIRAGVVFVLSKEAGRMYGGTGFAIGTDENNYKIITNHHVVSDDDGNLSSQLFVVLGKGDSQMVSVTIWAHSAAHDLAVLEVSAPIPGIKPLSLSIDAVLPNMDVYALGFPGTALDGSKEAMVITEGAISIINISDIFGDYSQKLKYIKSDAGVDYGNSGGPLVNEMGSVVGVNTAGVPEEGIGYALHVEELIKYLDSKGVQYTTTGEASAPSSSAPSSSAPSSSSSSYAPIPVVDGPDNGGVAAARGIGVMVFLVVVVLLLMSQRKKNLARGFAQPEQPQYGQPQYGQPQYGQPQYGQPQYGQPQYGQPQYGQPQYGQPQVQPQYGQPQVQPQYGQPQVQPQYGQPQVQPQYEHPPMQNQYVPPSAPQTAQQGMPYAAPPVAQQPYPPQGTSQPVVPPGGTGDGK